jgi:hypothetical protein
MVTHILEHKLGLFERRTLRKIAGPKVEEQNRRLEKIA